MIEALVEEMEAVGEGRIWRRVSQHSCVAWDGWHQLLHSLSWSNYIRLAIVPSTQNTHRLQPDSCHHITSIMMPNYILRILLSHQYISSNSHYQGSTIPYSICMLNCPDKVGIRWLWCNSGRYCHPDNSLASRLSIGLKLSTDCNHQWYQNTSSMM